MMIKGKADYEDESEIYVIKGEDGSLVYCSQHGSYRHLKKCAIEEL
jgi:hypothetical protein